MPSQAGLDAGRRSSGQDAVAMERGQCASANAPGPTSSGLAGAAPSLVDRLCLRRYQFCG